MIRNALLGAVVFGVLAGLAGYVWVAYEFPFAMVVPAIIGWYVVARTRYDRSRAYGAAILGGATFTAVFLFGVFLALTDGSPLTLLPWMAAVLAAILAGAVTGGVLDGWRGSRVMAIFAGAGMLLATMVTGVLRAVAPASVDVAGLAQSLYFAMAQGVLGAIVGAAVGAGVSWLCEQETGAQITCHPAST